jgi:hypothetical protein
MPSNVRLPPPTGLPPEPTIGVWQAGPDPGTEATEQRKTEFVTSMLSHLAITPAAEACQLHRSTVYRWMAADPAFRDAVNAAREVAVDALEDSAYARAMKGDVVLTIFLLKGNRPERYQDRAHMTHQAIGTVRVEMDDEKPILHTMATPQPFARIGMGATSDDDAIEGEVVTPWPPDGIAADVPGG